jgi:hypothetical protein
VLNIDDINASIMDAATMIAKATAKLVEASVFAQRYHSFLPCFVISALLVFCVLFSVADV